MTGLSTLSFAVRLRVVGRYFGLLSLSLLGLAGPPLLAALLLGEWQFALHCAGVLAVVAIVSVPLSRLRAPAEIQPNEALVITAALFISAAALMTWPLRAAGLPLVDALFESVSGITTTGLSTLASVEPLPRSVLFARAWMQWYGGLAIIVLALALVLEPGVVARRLGETGSDEDLVGSTRIRARRALTVYALLTLAAVLGLYTAGMSAFDAIAHGLAAISTGGFSTRDASTAAFPGDAAGLVLSVACLAGAIAFAAWYRCWSGGWRTLLADTEARWLIALTLAATAGLTVLQWTGAGGAGNLSIAEAAMLAVSAQTSTGFAPVAVTELGPGSQLWLMASMFVGGSAGSSAGGIKLIRFLILLRLLQLVLRRTALARHAVADIEVAGSRPGEGELRTVLVVVLLYVVTIFASWLPLVASGLPPLAALFEVVSAVGTVGLSAGVTGPDLAAWIKALLCIDMLMGRLEIVAVLVLLAPHTWIGKRVD